MASIPQAAVDIQFFQRPVPSLRTNFKWTLTGNLVYSLCQWAMLSVLAKAGNATIVGQFALGLAIAAPVFMFANLQLRAVQATDAKREYRFADYFTLRILTTVAGYIVVAAIAMTMRSDSVTRGVILLVALAKCIECVSDVIGGLLQLHERLDQVATSLMIRGVLSIFAFGVTFIITRSLIACTAAMCAAWLSVLLAYDVQRAREVLVPGEIWLQINWRASRKLALLSLPLGFVMMLISLNVNIPRYLLEHSSGPAELGIFASLAYLLVAVSLIVNALGQSATVRLSSMFAGRDLAGFRSLMFKLLGMGVVILAAAVSIHRQSRWLYGCWPLKGAFSQPSEAKARTKAKASYCCPHCRSTDNSREDILPEFSKSYCHPGRAGGSPFWISPRCPARPHRSDPFVPARIWRTCRTLSSHGGFGRRQRNRLFSRVRDDGGAVSSGAGASNRGMHGNRCRSDRSSRPVLRIDRSCDRAIGFRARVRLWGRFPFDHCDAEGRERGQLVPCAYYK
jgi:hypothetical protein